MYIVYKYIYIIYNNVIIIYIIFSNHLFIMMSIKSYYLILYTDMFLVLLFSGLMKLMFCRGKQNQMAVRPVWASGSGVSTNSSSQRPETLMNHDIISIKVSCVITRYRETCFHSRANPRLLGALHKTVSPGGGSSGYEWNAFVHLERGSKYFQLVVLVSSKRLSTFTLHDLTDFLRKKGDSTTLQ